MAAAAPAFAAIAGTWGGASPDTASFVSVSPTTGRILMSYSATILVSDDGGVTWPLATQGLAGATPRSFLAAGGSFFAIVKNDGGRAPALYRLTAGTTTWQKVLDGYLQQIACDATGQVLVTVSAVFTPSLAMSFQRSVDGGATWATTGGAVPVRDPGYVDGLAVIDRDTFLISDYEMRMHRTVDGGTTFTLGTGLPTSSSPDQVVVDRANPNLAFVQTYALGIYRSLDGGRTWSPASAGLPAGLPGRPLGGGGGAAGLFTGASGVYVIVSGGEGVYRTADGGDTWEHVTQSLSFPERYACSTVASDATGRIYAALGPWGVRTRTAASPAWTQINTGRVHGVPPSAGVLAVDPTGRIYCGANTPGSGPFGGAGLFYSEDNGTTWRTWGNDSTDLDIEGLATDADGNAYATTYWFKILRSADGGRNWSSPAPPPFSSTPTKMARDGSRLFLGSYWDGVAVSADRGVTWQALPNPGGGAKEVALFGGQRLNWLSADQSGAHGIARLAADGTTAELNNQGIPTASLPQLTGLAVGGGGAGYGWTPTALYRQATGTSDWVSLGLPEGRRIYSLAASPTGGTLAGTANGLFHRSEPSGAWEKVGDAKLDGRTITAIAVAPSGFVYAGTSGGIFYCMPAGFATGFPTFSRRVAEQTLNAGTNAVFSCDVVASPAATSRWQLSTDGGATWSDVPAAAPYSGVTTSALSVTSVTSAMQGQRFRVVVANSVGTVNSDVGLLTVLYAPIVVTPPQSRIIPPGASVTLSVLVDASPEPTYQWFRDGVAIAGATAREYTIVAAVIGQSGDYTVGITNARGTTVSAAATLLVAVGNAPAIVVPPANRVAGIGTGVTLSVEVTGTAPISFQWQKQGAALAADEGHLAGTGNAVLHIADTKLTDAGSYTVTVTNPWGAVTSSAAAGNLEVWDVRPSHAVLGSAGYAGGETVTIRNAIVYAGAASVLRWTALLPEGWTYVSAEVAPKSVTAGTVEWEWSAIPPSPLGFAFVVRAPIGEAGDRPVTALIAFRPSASVAEANLLVRPDPLLVRHTQSMHDADTDRDRRINLRELTRMIELFNTRRNTVRTGCYQARTDSEDGFAPDAARASATVVVLTRYHAADSNRDGRIGLTELTRVIELYNHRAATLRTGEYHVYSDSEDGFAPGP